MTTSSANKVFDHIPAQEIFEARFKAIDNPVLRSNLTISLKYIVFLITVSAQLDLTGSLLYSIYKNIILYTASICESVLHYIVKKFINQDQSNLAIMPEEWKDEDVKEIYRISADKKICSVTRHKISTKFTNQIQFQTLIKAAKNAKLINENLAVKLDDLREKRNRIHLAALEKTDDYYDKDDINAAFRTAKDLLALID